MDNSRVLLICYYFPPLGGAGVSRPLALYKHLPEFGITVDVLTVKPVSYRTYEPELLDGLDQKNIYRARSFDPQRIMYLLGMRKVKEKTISKGKKVSERFFPDSKIGWVKPAIKLGRVLAENKRYSGIISTSPPMSTHLIAEKLSREFHIPWIADFRDYWTAYKPEDLFDNERMVVKAKKLLAKIQSNARHITTVSDPIAEYLQTDNVIYNSFDEQLASLWKAPPKSDYFTIGVLGTLDVLRPIEPLVNTLVLLREKDHDLFQKIRVTQVGNINDPSFNSLVEKHNLQKSFTTWGHQPRKKTIELFTDAHMLYLGIDPEFEMGILTSRLFDMLASGRLLLCSVSDTSEVKRIIEPTGVSCCFRNNNVEKAVSYITENVKKWQSDSLNIVPSPDYALSYSSKGMVKKFVSLINNL